MKKFLSLILVVFVGASMQEIQGKRARCAGGSCGKKSSMGKSVCLKCKKSPCQCGKKTSMIPSKKSSCQQCSKYGKPCNCGEQRPARRESSCKPCNPCNRK